MIWPIWRVHVLVKVTGYTDFNKSQNSTVGEISSVGSTKIDV